MGSLLPDAEAIMAAVGDCWWKLIYCARGGNWPLADYYYRRVAHLEENLITVSPKHAERMRRFQKEALSDVLAAIFANDLPKLEKAYAAATDMANVLHGESGYDYIKWELPAEAPKGLRLGPVPGASTQIKPHKPK
ncbi:MAG: hypothetical protein ACRDF9_07530 [Candidatus Limnocylindria bacterium]